MLASSTVQPSWPPKSPHEALLSSPSGRKKLRELQNRSSPTPSPSGISRPTESFKGKLLAVQKKDESEEGLNDDDEDEETLQLKLQAIEAKLKLKKLRQVKSRTLATTSNVVSDEISASAASEEEHLAILRQIKQTKPRRESEVQVPHSPPPKRARVEDPRSPGRILLGIDKGRTGRDVSLKRVPSSKEGAARNKSKAGSSSHARRESPKSRALSLAIGDPSLVSEYRPKSFSERIAQTRSDAQTRQERQDKVRKGKSKGFGIIAAELRGFEAAAAAESGPKCSVPSSQKVESRDQVFTRDEVLQAYNRPTSGLIQRGNIITGNRSTIRRKTTCAPKSVKDISNNGPQPSISSRSSPSATTLERLPSNHDGSTSGVSVQDSSFEIFSALHLSKRILPHNLLARSFSGKNTFLLPDLLRLIKAPDYESSELDEDFVVLGVIASKSSPLVHKDDCKSKKSSEESGKSRGKYMVLRLTDLKWELDVFLFGTAFDKYWTLTPGTIIAILNPSIMPPTRDKRDTGKFSLTLGCSDDTVLEIGTARDLGFCKSVKKDGKICDQWVDSRHTEFCSYHVEVQLRKVKAGRMEVNTITAPFGPGGRQGPGTGGFGGRSRKHMNTQERRSGLRKEGPVHDRSSHSTIYIGPSIPGAGRSTASLIDDEDIDPDAFHRGTNKEERLRRRLAEREKERENARKLGEGGNGIGGEYLRARSTKTSRSGHSDNEPANSVPELVDAGSLGLVGGKASLVSLSPLKRKRSEGSTAMGWGGAFKRGLPSPTKRRTKESTESLVKTTRLVTADGIKDAGEDYLSEPTITDIIDNEDDLDIV